MRSCVDSWVIQWEDGIGHMDTWLIQLQKVGYGFSMQMKLPALIISLHSHIAAVQVLYRQRSG